MSDNDDEARHNNNNHWSTSSPLLPQRPTTYETFPNNVNNFNTNDNKHDEQQQSEFFIQLRLATPLMLSFVCSYILVLINISFQSRLGELPLAAAGVAGVYSNVFGNALLYGLNSGIDTLGSQAFGAGQIPMVRLHAVRGLFISLIVSCFVAVLWYYAEFVLIYAGGIEYDIAHAAQHYLRCTIPSLPAVVGFDVLRRFLECQQITLPQSIVQAAILPLAFPLNTFFIHTLDLGFVGPAYTTSIVNYIMLFALALYVYKSQPQHQPVQIDHFVNTEQHDPHLLLDNSIDATPTTCDHNHDVETCANDCHHKSDDDPHKDITKNAKLTIANILSGCNLYLAYALPSMLTSSLEWLGFELQLGVTARLQSTVAIAAFNVLTSLNVTLFVIPMSAGIAASTRIGAFLGAGQTAEAKHAYHTALKLTTTIVLITSTTMFLTRHVLVAIFLGGSEASNTKAVVLQLLPLITCMHLVDGLQGSILQMVRGMGKQNMSVMVNFVGFWVIALPLSIMMTLHWGSHRNYDDFTAELLPGMGLTGQWLALLFSACLVLGYYLLHFERMDWGAWQEKITNDVDTAY